MGARHQGRRCASLPAVPGRDSSSSAEPTRRTSVLGPAGGAGVLGQEPGTGGERSLRNPRWGPRRPAGHRRAGDHTLEGELQRMKCQRKSQDPRGRQDKGRKRKTWQNSKASIQRKGASPPRSGTWWIQTKGSLLPSPPLLPNWPQTQSQGFKISTTRNCTRFSGTDQIKLLKPL